MNELTLIAQHLGPLAFLVLVIWAEIRLMPIAREVLAHERAQSASMHLNVTAGTAANGGDVTNVVPFAQLVELGKQIAAGALPAPTETKP